MDENYTNTAKVSPNNMLGLAAAQQRPMPELGRLKAAAERINIAQTRVSNFLDRFHGSMPESASSPPMVPASDNYRNDLETLFAQIERLENVVSALDAIG